MIRQRPPVGVEPGLVRGGGIPGGVVTWLSVSIVHSSGASNVSGGIEDGIPHLPIGHGSREY